MERKCALKEITNIGMMGLREKDIRKMNKIKIAIIIFLIFVNSPLCFAENPWLHTFSPLKEFYVSPNGEGDGTKENPMSLTDALNNAEPGDLYWLMEGTYPGFYTLERTGSQTNPIVFRSLPGKRAKLEGALKIYGSHNWIWGLEVTDPNNTVPETIASDGIGLYGSGIHLINNIIHDLTEKSGIGGWDTGSGQVIYGNILYGNGGGSPKVPKHNIYTQNNFSKHGTKFYVNNISVDSGKIKEGAYNFHAYGSGGFVTGMHVENCLFRNGRFLIGTTGTNMPATNNKVIGNYFFSGKHISNRVQFGYGHPAQFEFKNNYLAYSGFWSKAFWGEQGGNFIKPAPIILTGNTMIQMYWTYLATSDGDQIPGVPLFDSNDIWDNNVYQGRFMANISADGQNASVLNLETWNEFTTKVGAKNWGINSTFTKTLPQKPKVILLPNEYEDGRVHLAIFNWGKVPSVKVDLSTVVSSATPITVHRIRHEFDDPIFSGIYSEPIDLQIDLQQAVTNEGINMDLFLITMGNQNQSLTPPEDLEIIDVQ